MYLRQDVQGTLLHFAHYRNWHSTYVRVLAIVSITTIYYTYV